jgi:hypothetical protein
MKNPFDTRTEQAVLADTVPDGFAAAVYDRLEERGLSPLATAQILLDTPVDGGWREVRQAVVDDLAEHPHDAVQVLNVAGSALGLPAAALAASARRGPDHAPIFSATLRMEYSDEKNPEASASGPTAKVAQQRAAVLLLAQLAHVTAPAWAETPEPPRAPAPPPALPGNGNPVSWLHEHAAKANPKLKQPAFALVPVADGFAARCRYLDRETTGEGRTKQAARTEAAARMVEVVMELIQRGEPAPA